MTTTTKILIYSSFLIGSSILLLTTNVIAQKTYESSIDLFFQDNPEKERIEQKTEKGEEIGYKIDHDTWYELHVWYDKDKDQALEKFIADN